MRLARDPGEVHAGSLLRGPIMGDVVRVLSKEGIERFRAYLADVRAGSRSDPPREILNDESCSAKLPDHVEVESRVFKKRLDAARYLHDVLQPLGHSTVDQNVGLWSWLSLYYFDQVCPVISRGIRLPGQDYRHILDLDYRRFYRHLLAGPYTVFQLHGGKAPILLCNTLPRISKFYEQLSARQGFITNKGVIEAANLLYYDLASGKPRRGASSAKRLPGTLLRFIDVVQQLDLTYDLYGMNGEEILALLPSEFNAWKRSEKGKTERRHSLGQQRRRG